MAGLADPLLEVSTPVCHSSRDSDLFVVRLSLNTALSIRFLDADDSTVVFSYSESQGEPLRVPLDSPAFPNGPNKAVWTGAVIP